MIELQVDFSDREIQDLMRKLRHLPDNGFHGALRSIGEAVKAMTVDAFEEGRSPGGKPWRPSFRAESEGGQTLVDTGILKNSIAVSLGLDHVVVGTNVVYAAIHQLGGKTGRGRRFTMPARPYLPDAENPPPALVDEAEKILLRSIERALGANL